MQHFSLSAQGTSIATPQKRMAGMKLAALGFIIVLIIMDVGEAAWLNCPPLLLVGKDATVVVGWRPCETRYPTLLSLGGRSHLKGENHPSPNGRVFWGDWAFP
jgi:hypothetical protein